jgi:general L-amino acid transport system substrate-binding protein
MPGKGWGAVLAGAALAAAMAAPTTAQAGATMDAIKARGQLVCGVNPGRTGFSAADSKGNWSGVDVDTCKAVAAALLGDASKVKFVPLAVSQRIAALQSGEIDLLARDTTWTLSRDAGLGILFTGITVYDGQGFMVPAKLKVTSATQLKGASVCMLAGSTAEGNLDDFSRANGGLALKPVVFDTQEAANKAFFSGRCQAYSNDASSLIGVRYKEAAQPDDYVVLPERISKEPLGPAVRRGDDDFFALVRWTGYAMVDAEEHGVTQANVDQMKASSTDPSIKRLLGTSDDFGRLLGTDKEWAYRIVKAVGNYGESYDRNLGKDSPLKLERGLNKLWTNGGLVYAPPIR